MATSATHSLLDTLVENLKIELVTKMHADIDGALRKRDNALHMRPEGDFFVTKKSKQTALGDLSGMFCYL